MKMMSEAKLAELLTAAYSEGFSDARSFEGDEIEADVDTEGFKQYIQQIVEAA